MKDLTKGKINKLFLSYLLPSISATFATSIYILADTIMIGRYAGENGIVALNIILPLFSVLFGMGVLFGVGGGVLLCVAKGKNDENKANNYFTMSLILAISMSVIFMLVFNLFFIPIMKLLGGNETTMPLISEYGRYITAVCPLFLFSTFLQAIVRNDKAPKTAMVGVITGGVLNIGLDYIFIFVMDMGMAGGALATDISVCITVLIILTHFLSKNNTLKLKFKGLKWKMIPEIFLSGLSSFVVEVAAGIVIFMFNFQILRYIGTEGVVVYGVISNCIIIAMSLFNGVAQAGQPIIATNYGAGHYDRVKSVLKIGMLVTTFIAAALFLAGEIMPNVLVKLFVSPSDKVLQLAPFAIRMYLVALLMMNYNIFLCTYFQAVLKAQFAFMLSLMRGFIISGILVFVLPLFMPSFSIWICVPIAEAVTLGSALGLMIKTNKGFDKQSAKNLQKLS